MGNSDLNIIKHAIIKKKVNPETFEKHKKILIDCVSDNKDLPSQTARYFGSKKASMELLNKKLFTTYEPEIVVDGYSIGYVFNLKDLPKGAENMTIVTGI